jgi:hypothetical protein
MGSGKTKREIADDILAYLAHNPDAQDTLAGIVEWWLLEQELRRQTSDVKEALAQLVREGRVIERKSHDSQIHYRVNPHRNRG